MNDEFMRVEISKSGKFKKVLTKIGVVAGSAISGILVASAVLKESPVDIVRDIRDFFEFDII